MAFGVLCLLELVVRVVAGAPPVEELFIRDALNETSFFHERDGWVTPIFQDRDVVPPFPARPTPGVRRVFVFGESSVRGGSWLPVGQEFPQLAERFLSDSGVRAEVVNLGRPTLDSRDVRRVVEAAMAMSPDVVVLYLGHNDVANRYFLRHLTSVGSTTFRLRAAFGRIALYGWTRKALLGPMRLAENEGIEFMLAPDVADPMDQAERVAVARSFARELRATLDIARAGGAHVILMTPVSNLAWPTEMPTCPEALPGVWQRTDEGWSLNDRAVSDAVLGSAADAGCPEALRMRAFRRQRAGDVAGAAADGRRARDLDPIPLRATSELVAEVRALGAADGVTLADVEQAWSASTGLPPAGRFRDPLHFSAEGHQAMAWALVSAVKATPTREQGRAPSP